MTQVTGILIDELGTVLANTTCAVVAIDQVVGQDGGGRVSRGSIVVTDGAGEFDADIRPGRYDLVVEATAPADENVKFSRIGRMTVHGDTMTLEEALDKTVGEITPNVLQQAIEAKDAAEAAAVTAVSAAAGVAGKSYVSRADFLADTDYVNGVDAPPDGTVVTAGGVQYVRSAGATKITDLPGWEIRPNQPAVPDRGLEVIAHRGGRNVNVENTMPALTGCISWAQAVETDVVVSSDGVTRLFHDTTVDSLTDGTGSVTAVTSEYLDGLQFTQLDGNPMQPLVRIPRFSEFLKWAVENDVIIYPEMKALRSHNDVDLIVDEVLDANADKLSVLQSFSMPNTLRALDRSEKISCGFLGSGDLATMQGFVDTLTPYPGRAWILMQFNSVLSNPGIVQYAAERLVGLGVWTVNTETDFRNLREIGVNHIMTDLPLGRGNRYA